MSGCGLTAGPLFLTLPTLTGRVVNLMAAGTVCLSTIRLANGRMIPVMREMVLSAKWASGEYNPIQTVQTLTLKAPITTAADDIHKYFLLFFGENKTCCFK